MKRASDLEKLDDDDENVFQKSIIDRYQYRPSKLESMCIAEFSATYVIVYKCDSKVPVMLYHPQMGQVF